MKAETGFEFSALINRYDVGPLPLRPSSENSVASLDDYRGFDAAWCPGCGNFSILKTFKEALVELKHRAASIYDSLSIGQAAKFPHYLKCNTFNGLTAGVFPLPQDQRANHEMPVFALRRWRLLWRGRQSSDAYHEKKRECQAFVHDNQVYGLTKGQASPTTQEAR